ncbi:hypothetical protein LCGC14_1805990 [marine sediment metagenome]|uniref:Glycosyltransferase 2-like domain-containing protein n=1 Tax=marine sediment metagenome TaxID=412755 RepID=A0A0F9J2Z2_9ZZZZ
MRDRESYLTIKYSVVMPLHKMHFFTDKAIKSVLTAIRDRKDVEFLILDDSQTAVVFSDKMIQHIKLPKMDLINKLIIGTQLAEGEYYCNADYDDISHPQKFEFFDKLLEANDIAGANQCIFFDSKSGKSYKPKDGMKYRTHTYQNERISFPWLQHSNSAIPLKWLRKFGYGNGQSIGMAHTQGHIMTDSPIWAKAKIDGLKFGFFEDIIPNAWKQCYQIIHNDNVNKYTKEMWATDFIEIKKPKGVL